MIFVVRRTFRTAAVFVVVLGAFLAVGLFLLTVDRTAGTAMSLFAGFFLLVIVVQTLRLGWRYAIAPEGIVVKRTLRRHLIARQRVVRLEAAESATVQEMLASPQWEEANAARQLDGSSTFRAQLALGKMIGYSSVPITFSQTKRGGPRSVTAVGSSAPGRFVTVYVTDGPPYILSPLDVEGFVAAWAAQR